MRIGCASNIMFDKNKKPPASLCQRLLHLDLFISITTCLFFSFKYQSVLKYFTRNNLLLIHLHFTHLTLNEFFHHRVRGLNENYPNVAFRRNLKHDVCFIIKIIYTSLLRVIHVSVHLPVHRRLEPFLFLIFLCEQCSDLMRSHCIQLKTWRG
jgi:hypothetical protein